MKNAMWVVGGLLMIAGIILMVWIMGGVFYQKEGFTSVGTLIGPIVIHTVCMLLGMFLVGLVATSGSPAAQ